jgi:3-ketosteroid 9alpha-monooxygenase subunit A
MSPAPGFPNVGHPIGWFQVVWSAEVAVGDVRPLRYFGEDLIVYRTQSGTAQVLGAHCPHMGAHIGYGGCVQGEDVVCPYHGWSWDSAGNNTMVPAEGKSTARRTIRTWPTHESNGIVWVWHDPAGREPLWPAPVDLTGVVEGTRYPVFPHCSRKFPAVRMRPQYVPENNVDIDHLRWVHRAEGPITLESFSAEEWCFKTAVRITYGFGKERTRLTPDGPIDVIVGAEIWGLGYQFTFFPQPDASVSIQAQTPIDDERCDMFQSVVVSREPGSTGDEPEGIAAARVREQLVQIERDIPIWEHLEYLPNPALTRQEAKPMVALRRWAQRFYPEPVATSASAPAQD